MLQHQSFTSTTMLDESSMTQSTSPSATPSSDVRLFRGRAAGLEDLHRYGPPHGAYAGPNTTTTTTSTSNSGGSLPEPREVPHHYYPGERLVPPTHDAAGTHWASPTEVMQLRSLCGDVVSKYRAELTKVESQLQAVQQERDALQLDLKKVEGLRGAYVDGAKAYASRKRQEGQWREEREMLRVQMQRLNVENQRLQLYIQQHGTRGRGHAMQDVVGGTTRSVMSVPSVLLSSGDAHPLPSPTHDATAASVGGEGGPNVDLPRRGTDTMDDTSMSLPHQERTLPLRPTATTHRGSSMLSEPRERSGAILGRHSGSGPLAGEPSPEGSSSSLRTPSTDVWSQSDNSRPRLGGAIPDASPRGTAIHTTSAEVGSSLATPSTSEPIQTAPSEEPPQAQRGERATAHVPPHYTDPGTASTLRTATTSYTESSSIPYLYHMPRTPAEAVEAEVKLFEALTRLTRQNEELAGQLKCVDTLHQLSTEQHDQRLLVLSRENEYLKREVRRLQDERDGYESQCHNLEQQHMEIEAQLHLLQQRVEEREMQVAQQAAKRHDEYEKERSSLKTQYEEEKLRIRSEADAAVAGAEAARRDAEVAFQRVVSERTPKQQELLLQVAELEKELAETRRESRESLQGVHGALREKSAACDQWEEKAHILEDSLRKAMAMRAEAQATATTLEEELGRARELRTTGEACIRSMDQRLEVSLAEVAGARQKLEDMEMMELHHQDALREVETLRMQLEREQRMWEAALTTCQVDHKRAMDVNVQRYEKLRLRYEAMKLRLEASRALPGGDGVEPRISAKTPATTDTKLVESDEDVEGHTEPPPPSARLECDSLSILRSSTITAARLNSSIHHAPQSCFPHLPLSSP